MRRPSTGVIVSAIAHGLIVVLMLAGLPFLKRQEELTLPAISVDVVNVSELAQAPKNDAPKAPVIKEAAPAKTPPKPKPPPPKPATPPPPPPEPEAPKPEPKKPEPKVEPKPEPKIEPKPAPPKPEPKPLPKKEEPKPAPKKEEKPPPPKKAEPKPKAEKKPLPKKPAPPQEKPEQSRDEFSESILKTLQTSEPEAAPEATSQTPPASAASGDSLTNVLSADELEALKRQIGQCWNFPAGASNADQLVVTVRVTMNPDRTVQNASISQGVPNPGHPMARQAEESALRAILSPACSPLLLPPEKHAMWKTFTLRFDPRYMLGY